MFPVKLTQMSAVLLLLTLTTGCSIKRYAIKSIGDSLASGSASTFATDDDPDLVGEALPFSLKLVESLLAEVPDHEGLLVAASSGFTQYAYVYVQQKADEMEDSDLAAAEQLRQRARRLYLRAYRYGLRGLETRHRGFEAGLRSAPKSAVAVTKRQDVPLMYWTAAALGSAIALSKNEPELVADQLLVEALIDRALELEPGYGDGAIHGFLVVYEGVRQGAPGDAATRSRRHFERAVALTGGQSAGPYVAMAENVAVAQQDKAEFERLLQQALAVNVDAKPEWRLLNLIMQRRARWLLTRTDALFLGDAPAETPADPGTVAERRQP
jgi:predicted anti-sigma-YlaC factor YlaD